MIKAGVSSDNRVLPFILNTWARTEEPLGVPNTIRKIAAAKYRTAPADMRDMLSHSDDFLLLHAHFGFS